MNKQSKFLVRGVIIIVIFITLGVFFWISQKDNLVGMEQQKTEANQLKDRDGEEKAALQASMSMDTDEVKKDIDSISENDFNTDGLSDQNLGL